MIVELLPDEAVTAAAGLPPSVGTEHPLLASIVFPVGVG